MTRTQFLDRIEGRILIADGAMGTLLHDRGVPWDASFEDVNRTAPDLVRGIHRDYVDAGAELIETNTFQANRISLARRGLDGHAAEINAAGVRIAREVVGPDILVAGSMGPIPASIRAEGVTPEDVSAAFHEQATLLADAGADLLIIETFSDLDMLVRALRAARRACDLPVVCQMSFTGNERDDERTSRALFSLEANGADVVGGNCGAGPTELFPHIRQMGSTSHIPLSAMPNASYPVYMNGRYVFASTPEYHAERAVEFAEAGANIIGGCCGTTPEYTRAIAARVAGRKPALRVIVPRPSPPVQLYERVEHLPHGFLGDAEDHTLILVELDPPKGLQYAELLDAARALKLAGVDALTSADNSLATIRLSTFVWSHLIQSEVNIPVIVHCACRDRNLIGQQSELMGAHVLGLRYILALTGDPASMANIGASSVYDTNSIGLIDLIRRLNRGENLAGASTKRPTDFIIGCALDPGGTKLDGQLRRLHRKVEAGAQFVLTQPLYDPDRIRELYVRVRAEFAVPVFVGIMPLVNARNAEFLHHEVPGIRIPEGILERMRTAPKEHAADEGVAIAAELVEVALDAGAPGIYVITPFNRHELALKLVPIIRLWDRMHRHVAPHAAHEA